MLSTLYKLSKKINIPFSGPCLSKIICKNPNNFTDLHWTADVARAINCNVRTVRRLRQRYRETGWTADRPRSGRPRVITPAQDRYIRISHLRDRYRIATTTARVTPGTHNPSISAQTVPNRLREAGLRA
uniref:Transposase Tc1-like domain-containing protein n=1 Tax=Oncorhynchus tshawytscha TaxID=74940 RepID=A0AAZ3PE60_ONCTS